MFRVRYLCFHVLKKATVLSARVKCANGGVTCGLTAFCDSVFFSRTSQQPAKYISTYKFFLQIWKTHLRWTQRIQILTRKSSDNCSFDSDKCLGAEFCPRGRGQGPENEQRRQHRKAVAVNAVVKPQELPPCYTRLCLRQRSTGVTEKAVPLGPPCLPRLVVSLKRTCLKQQPRGQSEKKKEKKAPCGAQMLPTLLSK